MFFYVWLFYIVILSVLSMSWHWFIENSRRLRYIIWLKKRNSLPLFAFLFKDPHSSFILFYNPKLITCTLRRKIAIQLFPCLLSIGIKTDKKENLFHMISYPENEGEKNSIFLCQIKIFYFIFIVKINGLLVF